MCHNQDNSKSGQVVQSKKYQITSVISIGFRGLPTQTPVKPSTIEA